MVIASRNIGFIPHHFELKNALKKLRQRIGFLESGAGFTLIELIVAISVIAILSTLGIAAFVDYSRRQELENATKDIVETLNLAKSRAQSQVKPVAGKCDPSFGYVLKGHKVIFKSKEYRISAVCGDDTHDFDANEEIKTTSSNITISNDPADNILFEVISGNAKITKSSSGIEWYYINIEVNMSGVPAPKKIHVDSNGIVYVI